MTRHLRDSELVDFAEGSLAAARAAHLDACAECRGRAEGVASALREVSAVEIPEPSPLFWDHFSARIRDHVAHETPARGGWWVSAGVRSLMPLVAALAVIIAVVSVTMLPRGPRRIPAVGELASSHISDTSAAADVDVQSPVDAQNADAWALLTAAASDMGVEEAHEAGMGTHVGAVDHEVTHLNQAELKELDRLLQSEMKRPSD